MPSSMQMQRVDIDSSSATTSTATHALAHGISFSRVMDRCIRRKRDRCMGMGQRQRLSKGNADAT